MAENSIPIETGSIVNTKAENKDSFIWEEKPLQVLGILVAFTYFEAYVYEFGYMIELGLPHGIITLQDLNLFSFFWLPVCGSIIFLFYRPIKFLRKIPDNNTIVRFMEIPFTGTLLIVSIIYTIILGSLVGYGQLNTKLQNTTLSLKSESAEKQKILTVLLLRALDKGILVKAKDKTVTFIPWDQITRLDKKAF